jgi:alkylated DNA repair dioxygenase AlkB
MRRLSHSEDMLQHLPNADISHVPNFLSPKECETLYRTFLSQSNWHQDQITLFGKTHEVPRLTAFYGEKEATYTYSRIEMQAHSWFDELLQLKQKVDVECESKFTSCLLNLYKSGKDSNGWHQDNEKELGVNPEIASVSLGGTRLFKLKHITRKNLQTITIPLEAGSLLLMKGETQHYWKHCIPKTKKPVSPRINLTFRKILQSV